jgi:DNA-directed RNA polymerase specialized sigma24 family protein
MPETHPEGAPPDPAPLRRDFDAVFGAASRHVWAFAARRTGDRGAAEALAAAILERCFRHLEERPGHIRFEAWLYAIACDEARQRGFGPRTRPSAEADALTP